MTARSLLFLPLILSISGAAQNMVQPSSFAFSDGVLPTLSFMFEGTDVRIRGKLLEGRIEEDECFGQLEKGVDRSPLH